MILGHWSCLIHSVDCLPLDFSEIPLEPYKQHLCGVCAKGGWDVEVYAVHTVEFGHSGWGWGLGVCEHVHMMCVDVHVLMYMC